MTTSSLIRRSRLEHLEMIERIGDSLDEPIATIGRVLAHCLAGDGSVFWCGNGGSAADSQHLAAELVGRFKRDRRPLRSLALTTDSSVLTCVANDYAFADVFARQIEGLGRARDAMIGISTSGNSENIARAVTAAKRLGMVTVGLLGKGGGSLRALVDHALIVPSDSTARIQEGHILVGHVLCEVIERELGLD